MTALSRYYYIDEIDRHEFHGYALAGSLYFGQTKFQTIELVESPKFGKMLILDGKIQSAALDEHIYHEALVHPAMLLHPHPRRILILGGGEGAALREVLRYQMVEEVVMVDLDEEVVSLCRMYLPEWSGKAFEDSRTTLVCEDALDYLQRSTGLFDVVIQDITDPVTVDFTEAYYRSIQRRLADRGILAMQALELSLADFAGHLRARQEVGGVFSSLLSYLAFVPSFRANWGFLLATTGEELDPFASGALASRFDERLGPGAGLRFYEPAVHTALCTLPRELAQLIGQKTA
ncbi:MAG: spermidine synthase [candidate division NC10 bacterium]|jgi:spermidine synthase|nr:spermidine synthase [candidate division NC10 bacterium]MCZ6550811.1 spermidine synthase [candidate division NC10 bacterium]